MPSPDSLRLVVPKAFIILAAGYRSDAASAYDVFSKMRGRLAPYKRIRRIEFVESLPQTISGKIKRAELRQQEAHRRRDGIRTETEFWEESFPELSTRHD